MIIIVLLAILSLIRGGLGDWSWSSPLWLLAWPAYCMAALAVLMTIAWVITRVGALIPLRVKLYAAAAIWTAMMAGLLALASFVTITLAIG